MGMKLLRALPSACFPVLLAFTATPSHAAAATGTETVVARPMTDTWTRGGADGWDAAATGEMRIYDEVMSPVLVLSPDSGWIIVGEPDESAGLDVAVLRLSLVSLRNGSVRSISDGAGSAQWSPNSRYVFIATGPRPYLYDVLLSRRVEIVGIDSGIENWPVWVSSWSADGRECIVHRQARCDDDSERRAWRVRLP